MPETGAYPRGLEAAGEGAFGADKGGWVGTGEKLLDLYAADE